MEDGLARSQSREPRDLLAEAARGDFWFPRENLPIFEGGGRDVGVPVVSPKNVEESLEEAIDQLTRSEALQGSRPSPLEMDALLAERLRHWWRIEHCELELPSDIGLRQLSPVEIRVRLMKHERLFHEGAFPDKFWPPEQFERAVRNFYEWLGPVVHRPTDTAVKEYRESFTNSLDVLDVEADERARMLVEFDRFYDELPDLEFLAASTSQSRALARYQREEDAAAAGVRKPRNLALAFRRGEFFAPDLDPAAIVCFIPEEPEFVSLEGGCRPDEQEQVTELAHLRSLLDSFGVSPEMRERVVAGRKAAWQELPETLPDRYEKLLWRKPSAEELDTIATHYGIILRLRGLEDDAIALWVRALRDYYQSRAPEDGVFDLMTGRDRKENLKIMREIIREYE